MTTDSNSAKASGKTNASAWKAIVARYQKPCAARATWQLVNTLVPYALLWAAMFYCKDVSWWLVVPLAVLAGGFLVRIFIIFHDCGHGSYFESRRANDICGSLTGVLTFTPYFHWRQEHALHHSHSGDLDRRGRGDVWTLTVQEYLEASRWKKFSYRLSRNPLVMLVIAPLVLFLIVHRVPERRSQLRERLSVYFTNLALLVVGGTLAWIFGLVAYLAIQVLVLAVAGSAGVWLFYVQHQFEGVYWQRSKDWDYAAAALEGSSFYKLPKVLQWFSGNIGFHHIHHLSPRIPNYHLEKCHEAEPLFQTVKSISLLASFKSFGYRLWDEPQGRLVGYGRLRTVRVEQQEAEASVIR